MRADRLVSVLLLLQRRGRVTVAEIAEELEISPRTARRDLEALGMAGISVYSTPGRNGGWRLAGDGRTDLSGLSEREAHALFLVAGPSADATPELKAALRKLIRALPEPLRDSAERAGRSVVVDPVAWSGRAAPAGAPPRWLGPVQQAVLTERRVHLTYVGRSRETSTRVVDPLGLVAKGPHWYLIAETDDGQRTFRVDRITDLEPTGETIVRPDDFDLDVAWAGIAERVQEIRSPLVAEVRIAAEFAWFARQRFGTRLRDVEATSDGGMVAEIRGYNERELASLVAGFGAGIEVVAPPEVRAELQRIGAELVARYGPADRAAGVLA